MRFFILLCYFTIQYSVLYSQNQINLKYHLKGIEDISGSYYKYEEFNTGDVYFIDSDTTVKYQLNYNAYTEAIEFLKNDTIYTVTNPYEIKKINLNDDLIVFANYSNEGSISKGFFFEIIDSYISLYKRETVIYVPTNGTNYQNNISGEFKKLKPQYYISILGCPAFQVKNKKNIISEFSNNPVVIDYLEKERINVNSEGDLIKFAEYINHYRTK